MREREIRPVRAKWEAVSSMWGFPFPTYNLLPATYPLLVRQSGLEDLLGGGGD